MKLIAGQNQDIQGFIDQLENIRYLVLEDLELTFLRVVSARIELIDVLKSE